MDRSSAIFNTPACIVDPHTNLMIGFSALMGYIFFNVEPLYGFNFKQEVERMSIKDITVLYSDSIQGFSPGMRYVMDFPAEEPPEGMGIPRTTDRYGNHLDKSYHFEFNTAHVRIILPAHEPCFYLRCPPDLWYKLSSPDDPWFAVEATPRVRRLSATGPDGNTAEVVFEDLSIPSGRTENSFHTIYPTEVPGSPGCPTTIEVHAYGAAGEYLGKDRLRVYAYPPPESIRIVTYNAHNNKSDAGFSWRGRFDNFVRHIVVRYQPAIIAVQEVMLDIEGLDGCEDMSKGEYLHYLVDGINQAIGRSGLECGKYHLATAVRSGFWPWNVTFPCDRWQGEAIIYDSQQVRLIYPQPRSGAPEFRGCTEWSEGQEDLYEFFVPRDLHNDCMTNHGWGEDGDNALVSRAVFEFPLHSNRYFSFYNVQHAIPPCAIPATITDYILDRQNTFREDLAGYLLDEVRARRPFSIYPPIYAGDMNTREPGDQTGWEWMDRCNLPAEQRQLVQDSFFDAPSPGPIDKVWVGTTDFWNHEVGWKIMQPPSHMDPAQMSERQCREEWYPPFSCFALGYYVVGEDNVYSDHSPSMVEVEPSGQ